MNEDKMREYLIDWFDNGFTLKELFKIVLDIINTHDYKDH